MYDYFFGPRFHRQREQIARCLEHFARTHEGRLTYDATSTVFPVTTFETPHCDARLVVCPNLRSLDQFDVSLTLYSGKIQEPHYFPVLEVFNVNMMEQLFRAPWMQPVVSGDTAFDHRFHVRILTPLRIRAFLGGRERDSVFKLLYLFGRHNLYLATEFNRLLARKTMVTADLTDLAWAETLWKPVARLFRLLEQKVIEEILGEDEMKFIAVTHTSLARCKVCGESILFDEVRCGECDTPHHHDCWMYSGGCTVYGCGAKSYRVARPVVIETG